MPGLVLDDDSSIFYDEDDFMDATQDMMGVMERSEGRALRRNRSNRIKKYPPKKDEKLACQRESKVMDSQSVETTETEDESEQEEHSKHVEKSVRWADSTGHDLAVTHSIDSVPYISTRVVILLLDIKERLFEFVQCEFSTDNRLTVSDTLKQLPSFASIEFLRQQRFRTLCRPDEEMINMLPIQNYHVREGEILVAAGGYARPKEVMAAAAALLKQKKLVRAVHKAKLSGRALQRLLSSAELAESLIKGRECDKKESASNLDDSLESAEDQDVEDSALIVKVLSRELGEELFSADFADFSFPTFEAGQDELMKTAFPNFGRPQENNGWFDELLADSFEESSTSYEFGEHLDPPEFKDSFRESLESAIVTFEEEEDQGLDAFGSSSHAWSSEDAVVPDFSFSDRRF